MASSQDRLRRESAWRTDKARYLQNHEKDAAAPWRLWLRERYARIWYLLGCLFLDVIVAGTVLQTGVSPTQPWRYVVAVALVIGLTVLEFLGLHRLWPPEPLE